jgi:hypothetical protein
MQESIECFQEELLQRWSEYVDSSVGSVSLGLDSKGSMLLSIGLGFKILTYPPLIPDKFSRAIQMGGQLAQSCPDKRVTKAGLGKVFLWWQPLFVS